MSIMNSNKNSSTTMNISQADRDKLRDSQHKLLTSEEYNVIGNLIEHRSQDPKTYKQIPNKLIPEQATNTSTKLNGEARITTKQYKSKYLEEDLTQSNNCPQLLEEELPASTKDFQASLWLNMNQVEFDKLEWMTDKAEKAYQEQFKDTTRFDAKGRALPTPVQCIKASQVSTKCDKEIIGNGEIAEGHDLESLVNMLDSKFHPQATYALQVLEKIAALATMGFYDGTFSENIHELILNRALLRVRHRLDSPNESNRQNALKCLRSMLCNTQVDEIVLDRMFPLLSEDYDPNFWLQTHLKDNKEFTIEMKDNECAEKDAILTLVYRTDIINRFCFLLEAKFDYTYHECILDILIRIARHSVSTCLMLNDKQLLERLTSLFIPSSIVTKDDTIRALSVKALKLIRIISQAFLELEEGHIQHRVAQEKVENKIPDQILTCIEAYFFIDCFGASGKGNANRRNNSDQLFKLHIETLRIMKIFCRLKKYRSFVIDLLAIGRESMCNSFASFRALVSKKQLDSKISFDWQYAAHLIDVAGFLVKTEKYHSNKSFKDTIWYSYIKPVLLQWLTDIIQTKVVPHLDVSIAIATAVQHYKNRLDEQGVKLLIEVMIDPILKQSKNYNLFKALARSACEKSQLPEMLKASGHLRDPKQLPSYGCLNYNTSFEHSYKLSPVVDTDSPFILLNMFLSQIQDYKEHGKIEDVGPFTNNYDMLRYIKTVSEFHSSPLTYEPLVQHSLLAQLEVQTIGRSLILLSNYYLGSTATADVDTTFNPVETAAASKVRNEGYCNVCYHIISTIGLINAKSGIGASLKDTLLEEVLLDSRLQSRVSIETFLAGSDPYEYEQRNYITGKTMFQRISDNNLEVLLPVYMSCEQPNRFWILQPLLYYYQAHSKEPQTAAKFKDNWFKRNIAWRVKTGALASCCDNKIISTILTFNYTMVNCSPTFNHLVVKSNLEDYLCLMGTIFLHDDLFLDDEVTVSFRNNLRTMLRNISSTNDDSINTPFQDASRVIKLLNLPLGDYFAKLVDQYEAVSYGNESFSNFILLFLTPKSDKSFRRLLFGEKACTCLPHLRITRDCVWSPEKMLTGQRERDPEIKLLLKKAGEHIPKGSFLDYYRHVHITQEST